MLLSMAKGAVGQANINAQEVQAIEIIIPPEPLQEEFDILVEQGNASKMELKQSINKINGLLAAIMSKVFNS